MLVSHTHTGEQHHYEYGDQGEYCLSRPELFDLDGIERSCHWWGQHAGSCSEVKASLRAKFDTTT